MECKFCGVPDVKSTTHFDNPCPEFIHQLRKVVKAAENLSEETCIGIDCCQFQVQLRELHKEHAEQATDSSE